MKKRYSIGKDMWRKRYWERFRKAYAGKGRRILETITEERNGADTGNEEINLRA